MIVIHSANAGDGWLSTIATAALKVIGGIAAVLTICCTIIRTIKCVVKSIHSKFFKKGKF